MAPPTEPLSGPADVFHIIGFTAQHVSDGAMSRMMNIWNGNLRKMAELRRRFGTLGSAVAAGLLARELVEIFGLASFERGGAIDVGVRKQYGEDYQSVEFLNDAALRLCLEFNVSLPPVIGRTTRAELPSHLEVIVQFPTCREFAGPCDLPA
jgi:hypothetical protein